ncbi:MAG: glycosyl hydrolase [Saprospirales bacterium]|nr:glycosyl hydrolase [Saprospirales bacterium]
MRSLTTLLFLTIFLTTAFSQTQPAFTPSVERIKSYAQHQKLVETSLLGEIPFTNIGPAIQSGRVADIDVSPDDPTHFYIAYASGGLWKSTNNGMSFEPLFDREMVMTIGDIAVDWGRNTIWLGSGEVNSSRSSYSGTGVFKSTDGGKTWMHMGLGESHHIGRILLHPTDPNTAWVAALGHLYSPNQERGVYKTTDGGKTWTRVLFANDNAGAIDLVLDPANPDIVYAATWERTRRAWNFTESGAGSGIYKSTDGGNTWSLLTDAKSGFPTGDGVGRIGLDAAVVDGKTLLYAVLDNQTLRPKKEEEKKEDVLTKDALRTISAADFLKLDTKKIQGYLNENDFPEKYDAEKVQNMVRSGKIQPIALVEYVEDANTLLFDTDVTGAEVYVSDDGGKTWKKTHEGYLDDLFYTYGYYFAQIRVAPQSEGKKLYIMGVPVLRSDDGGQTWKSINGDNVHGDHHALWVSPSREGHLLLGNDGGLNISYDDGEHWVKCNTPPVGQFYGIAVDMASPYHVFGGLQDNGVWRGPSTYKASTDWHDSGEYPYKSIMGGDGMQVAVDTRDNNIVYTGFQFGNYFRIDLAQEDATRITPQHDLGERPLRWNWQSPIHLSVHNQDIFYMGSNKLHRSFDQGKTFEAISGDLTKGGKKGDVSYGTLSTIHESSMKFGLIYTGSDDGLVHVTKDGGNTWTNISSGLPEDMWVSRVQASSHELSRVYVTLNGYRWDNFEPFVYVSEDYGQTWTRIGRDLPLEPVNVIREDPVNPDLLYVGTDHGLYASLDRGQTFMALTKNLPNVAVHDLVIHPKAKELVVGTHGRSMFKANVKELQQLKGETLAKPLVLFDVPSTRYRPGWGGSWSKWGEARVPEVAIPLYASAAGSAKFTLSTGEDLVLKTWKVDLKKGLNYPIYNLNLDEKAKDKYEKYLNENRKADAPEIKLKKGDNGEWYLQKGAYTLKVEMEKEKVEGKVTIE